MVTFQVLSDSIIASKIYSRQVYVWKMFISRFAYPGKEQPALRASHTVRIMKQEAKMFGIMSFLWISIPRSISESCWPRRQVLKEPVEIVHFGISRIRIQQSKALVLSMSTPLRGLESPRDLLEVSAGNTIFKYSIFLCSPH